MDVRMALLTFSSVVVMAISFGASAAETYKVSATLSHKGKAFASPVMLIEDSAPGTVEVSGPDGYKLLVTVASAGGDIVDVAAKVDSVHGAMAPTVTVRLGQAATVVIADLELGLTVEPHGS